MALFPSPEKVIAGRIEKLARAASVRPDEGTIGRMAGAQSAGNYFDSSVEINIDVPGHQQHTTLSRDDIVQTLMAAHVNGGLTVKFPDISVTVASDGMNAQADVTVEAQAPGDPDLIVQQMRFTLRKIDGKWLITRVQTVRSLS